MYQVQTSIGLDNATPAGSLQLEVENIEDEGVVFQTVIKQNVDIPGTEVVAFSPDSSSYTGFLVS